MVMTAATLAMTLAVGWDLGQNSAWQVAIQARMACTSSAVRTKEAATKSMSLLTPYLAQQQRKERRVNESKRL